MSFIVKKINVYFLSRLFRCSTCSYRRAGTVRGAAYVLGRLFLTIVGHSVLYLSQKLHEKIPVNKKGGPISHQA